MTVERVQDANMLLDHTSYCAHNLTSRDLGPNSPLSHRSGEEMLDPAGIIRAVSQCHLPKYQHEPLVDYDAIRLLRVRPRDPLAEIIPFYIPVIDVVIRRLRDPPNFIALSYCWGDLAAPDNSCIIRVGDRDLQVTRLPYEFLLQASPDTYFWIDQISIDQDNPIEKATQVSMMNRIFEYAEAVWAWLGSDRDYETKHALKLMMNVVKDPTGINPDLKSKRVDEVLPEHICPTKLEGVAVRGLGLDNEMENVGPRVGPNWHPTEYFYRRLAHLMDNPYFRRLWTVQELIVAKKARFVCGSTSINAWAFFRAVTILLVSPEEHRIYFFTQKTDDLRHTRMKALLSTRRLGRLKYDLAKGHKHTLIDLYQTTIYRKCKDLRDHIFALRGMAQPHEVDQLNTDYKGSVLDAYRQFALIYLTQQNSLLILDIIGPPEESGKIEDDEYWPSWVPRPFEKTLVEFDSKRSHNSIPPIISLLEGDRLSCRGKLVTTLSEVFDRVFERLEPCHHRMRHDRHLKIRHILNCARSHISNSLYRGVEPEEVLWRTLIRNCAKFTGGQPAALGRKEEYLRWCDSLKNTRPYNNEKVPANLADWTATLHWQGLFRHDLVLAASEDGHLGMVWAGTRMEDRVCLLRGGSGPYIIRPQGQSFRLMGRAYVHGLMDEGSFDLCEEPEEDIVLV